MALRSLHETAGHLHHPWHIVGVNVCRRLHAGKQFSVRAKQVLKHSRDIINIVLIFAWIRNDLEGFGILWWDLEDWGGVRRDLGHCY